VNTDKKSIWASKKKKGQVEPVSDSKPIQTFFESLESIKEQISAIRYAILSLNESQQRGLNNAITETQKIENEREIETFMDKIQQMSRKIQGDLKQLDQETKELQKQNPGHSDLNIRVAQHAVLLKMFVDVMQEYKTAQEDHQARLKERMVKQALVVNPNASENEVQKMIQEPVFGMAVANSTQRREAITALDDITRKHHEVARITDTILVFRAYAGASTAISRCIGPYQYSRCNAREYWKVHGQGSGGHRKRSRAYARRSQEPTKVSKGVR
jgi:syntaxin 1A/syntaxin 1B/2/3